MQARNASSSRAEHIRPLSVGKNDALEFRRRVRHPSVADGRLDQDSDRHVGFAECGAELFEAFAEDRRFIRRRIPLRHERQDERGPVDAAAPEEVERVGGELFAVFRQHRHRYSGAQEEISRS